MANVFAPARCSTKNPRLIGVGFQLTYCHSDEPVLPVPAVDRAGHRPRMHDVRYRKKVLIGDGRRCTRIASRDRIRESVTNLVGPDNREGNRGVIAARS